MANGKTSYLFEEPTSLNTLDILPDLVEAGVVALKIEGRQRGKAYVEQVVTGFRQAVDALANGQPAPAINLDGLTEGQKNTAGAYDKGWR